MLNSNLFQINCIQVAFRGTQTLKIVIQVSETSYVNYELKNSKQKIDT